jgi:hypothetical protein
MLRRIKASSLQDVMSVPQSLSNYRLGILIWQPFSILLAALILLGLCGGALFCSVFLYELIVVFILQAKTGAYRVVGSAIFCIVDFGIAVLFVSRLYRNCCMDIDLLAILVGLLAATWYVAWS